MRRLIAPLLLASALASGTAAFAAEPAAKPAAKPAANACFRAQDVNGWTAVDDKTVNVRVGVKDIYQLTLFSPSTDIDWSQHIGLESRGGSWICSSMDATIIVPGAIGPQRTPVTAIRKLSPDEVAALPRNEKP